MRWTKYHVELALSNGADLRHADLRHADLRGADLRHADLRGAYLSGAYLRHADLRGADLRGADLSGVYLSGVDGKVRKLIGFQPVISLAFDHDWHLMFFRTDKGIAVNCGCRWFDSIDAARTHWLSHENPQRQRIVLPALNALTMLANAQGWKVEAITEAA